MDGKKLDLILNAILDMKKNHEKQFADLHKMFADIKEENRNIKITVKNLAEENKILTNTITKITNDVNILNQQQIKNNLVIAGIPYKKGENLKESFASLSKLLQVNITNSNFQIRRFTNSDSKTNNILVELDDYSVKKMLLKNQKSTNILTSQMGFKEGNSIVMFNQLTKHNLDILAEAKKLKNSCNFKFVWYQNYKILTRLAEKTPIIVLNSKIDVLNLISSSTTGN